MKGEFEDRVCIFQIALKGSRVVPLIVYIQRVKVKKSREDLSVRIVAISIGKVAPMNKASFSNTKPLYSGIEKRSISSPEDIKSVFVGELGLQGDEHYERSFHGGVDQALYAYPTEHYDFWQQLILNQKKIKPAFSYGFFGENLSIKGFCESQVFVGDRWLIGDVELEVTKLREPCFKLNIKLNYSQASKAMIQSAKSGWYLKVLRSGFIQSGDWVEVNKGSGDISIQEQNSLLYQKNNPTQDLFE